MSRPSLSWFTAGISWWLALPTPGLVKSPNIVLKGFLQQCIVSFCNAPTSVDQTTFVWTDGSCDFPEFFWMCKGGFSIINQDGECVHNGTVQHPVLSSYSTELRALIYAFCMDPNPVWVSSDCDSILSQTNQLISSLKSRAQLATFWMVVLLALHLWTTPERLRQSLDCQMMGIPSHLLETTPVYQISDAEARAAGSSWIDIRCNRQADRFAKQAICQDNQPNSFTREIRF